MPRSYYDDTIARRRLDHRNLLGDDEDPLRVFDPFTTAPSRHNTGVTGGRQFPDPFGGRSTERIQPAGASPIGPSQPFQPLGSFDPFQVDVGGGRPYTQAFYGAHEFDPERFPGGPAFQVPFALPDQPPAATPAPSGAGGLTFGGGDPLAWIQGQFGGLAPTSQNLEQLYNALRTAGVNVSRPTRAGGAFSDDKLTINGQMYDFIRDVGGPQAAWQMGLVGGEGGGGAQGTGYGDANTDLFINEILSRLEGLRQPINDPFRQLLELAALARVNDLGGAPYTAGEDAALRARYLEPLAQARDAALERRREELGARGYLPSSGLYQDQLAEVDRQHERNVAGATNEMAVRAIDERQRRSDQQLAILEALTGLQRTGRAEDDARAREIITTAGLLPALDERRLDQLLRASGEGTQQQSLLLSTLMQLAGMNQQGQLINNQNRQASAAAWGSILPYLLDALTGGGGA